MPVGHALADGLDHLLVEPGARAPDLDLDRAHALGDPGRDLLDPGVRRPERQAPADEHPVVDPAAEHLVHGPTRDLARDVPERHLDPGLGGLREVHRPVHRHERPADLERVRADQSGAQQLAHVVALDRTVAAVVHRDLAEALDAVRGPDPNNPEVADPQGCESAGRDHRLGPRRADRVRLDGFDREGH